MELRGFVPARSGCSILVVFLCNVLVGYGATLVNYTEEEVWDYIRGIPRVNLTQKCSNSLNLVRMFFESCYFDGLPNAHVPLVGSF